MQEDDAATGGKGMGQLDVIIGRLAACANREAADALAVEFCYVNSKLARRRLVKALHSLLPRIQMVQIPCFARLTATLSQCVKDIGPPLVSALESEFFHWFHKKEQSAAAAETRQRNARFLAELCKFRVCPSATLFNVLKACLDDFTQQNVDVACACDRIVSFANDGADEHCVFCFHRHAAGELRAIPVQATGDASAHVKLARLDDAQEEQQSIGREAGMDGLVVVVALIYMRLRTCSWRMHSIYASHRSVQRGW